MKRIPVSMTDDERGTIETGMKIIGFRSISDFLRFCALQKSARLIKGSDDD